MNTNKLPHIKFLRDRTVKPTRWRNELLLLPERLQNELSTALETENKGLIKLLQVIAVAANEAATSEEALQICLEQICIYTGWMVGHAYRPDHTGKLISTKLWYPKNPHLFQTFRQITENTSFSPGIGLPGRVWSSGKPAWIVDVNKDVNFPRRKKAKNINVKAGFAFPVLVKTEVVAVLEFFATEAIEPNESLLEVVANIGTQLGRVVERDRASMALKESEERYRQLIELSPDGIFIECEGKFVFVNNQCIKLLGATNSEELIGKSVLDFVHCDYRAVVEEQTQKIASEITTVPLIGEKWRRLDGTIFDVEVKAAPFIYQEKPAAQFIIRDISDRKQAEKLLQQAKQKYHSIFENAVEGIFQTTVEGYYLTANPMLAHIYGYDSAGELIEAINDIKNQLYVDPNHREKFQDLVQKNGTVWGFESQVYRRDGSIIWISENARAIYDTQGKLLGYEGTAEDITERKRVQEELRQSKQMLQLVMDNIPQFIFWKDRNLVYQGCNRNFAIVAGLKNPAEIIGKTDYDLAWKTEESDFFCACDDRVMDRDTPEYHIIEPQLQANGKQAWLDTNRIPLHDAEGKVVGILGTYEDITDRQIAQERIRYQAMHDLLTGLPNRTNFNEQLETALVQAKNNNHILAVMFLDLDRFKTINDTLGHAIGDRLLQEMAERVEGCLRQNDIVARWGGDEFTVLLPRISNAQDAAKVGQRILDVLKPAFNLDRHQLYISNSIGIALYPQDGENAETLLRNADAALYRVKAGGRNNYQFYTPAMSYQACELLLLENQLHRALAREEFVLYYQPQININTGKITGVEALIRWQHPELGLVSPAKFIPLAEENGLIVSIGEWVLETACQQNKAWIDAGMSPIRVAVNLSARQFHESNLIEIVSRILSKVGLESRYLDLEITETLAMQNIECTYNILKELNDMGVHLSMDDFGTGYSSLNYLKNFSLHSLKIDKSFIDDLTNNSQNLAIVNAIMTLGKGLNLRVIAEGVETISQREVLRSLKCENMQGYLFSPPLSTTDITEILYNQRKNIHVL